MQPKKVNFTDNDILEIEKVFQKIGPTSVWFNLKRNDFLLKRFSTGMINEVTHCALTPDALRRLDPPRCDYAGVVIKFFTTDPTFPYCPIQRTVINTIASAYKLVPHLIYIDDKVSIQRCLSNARMPNENDDLDDCFLEQAARMLARFHSMPVPVSTNMEAFNRFMDIFQNDFPGSKQIRDGSYREILMNTSWINKYSMSMLFNLNFQALLNFFFNKKNIDSPIVFCHMDFQRDNRLIEETFDPETGFRTKKLYFIDLDFSMFYCRSIDFGTYFETFGQKYYRFDTGSPPEDEKLIKFIEFYRDECSKIFGNSYLENEENSLDKILVQTKNSILHAYFLSIYVCLTTYFDSNTKPEEKEEFIRGATVRAEQFLVYKNILLSQGLLSKEDAQSFCYN